MAVVSCNLFVFALCSNCALSVSGLCYSTTTLMVVTLPSTDIIAVFLVFDIVFFSMAL